MLLIGVFGASLFYGDAVLTPAISVLSAVEGLEVGTSAFKPYVVPIAVVVIVALFVLQSRGTAVVGQLFGPITLAWFLALGAAGLHGIVQHPGSAEGAQPALCDRFPDEPRRRIVRRAGRGGAGRDRRRGAVRRHGPFRQGRRSASPGSAWWSRRWC